MFNNINMCINDIPMLLNFIRHIYTTSTLFFEHDNVFHLLCLHVMQECRSRATLRGTESPQVICMFVCVYVYVLNANTTPCPAENSNARSLDLGLMFCIQIDTHQSKSCHRGQSHRSQKL